MLERLEQWPAQQVLAREQATRRVAALRGADREQLTRVVPLVERLVDVDALVTLEPDQARAGRSGECPRDLGLARAGLALEQQRLPERGGEMYGGRKRPVGEVALTGERPRRVLR